MAKTIVLPSMEDMENVKRYAHKASGRPLRRRFTVQTQPGKVSHIFLPVVHKGDPKDEILNSIGDIPPDLVQFSRIMVAVYIPPIVTKTEGGIHLAPNLTDQDIEESRWQGKAALVVAMGPQAYKDSDDVRFNGEKIEVGDWVWFRPSDGMPVFVNEVLCRVFDSERYIIGKLPHPDMVA